MTVGQTWELDPKPWCKARAVLRTFDPWYGMRSESSVLGRPTHTLMQINSLVDGPWESSGIPGGWRWMLEQQFLPASSGVVQHLKNLVQQYPCVLILL